MTTSPTPHRRWLSFFVASAAVSLLAACSSAAGEPNVGSVSTGQLIDPALVRRSPVADIAAECGSPTTPDASLIRRPYLQRVTEDGASLLWTSTGPTEAVEIWEADDEPRSLRATDQETRFLGDGAQRAVRLEGLEPATLHCYRVVRDGEVVFGPSGFRTAPTADDPTPIDVLVFGDSGNGSTGQIAVRAQMETVPADLMIHTGDVAYDDGTMSQFESAVFDVYEGLFDAIPFFPSIGNHDDRSSAAAPYREVFELPTNGGSADDLERRYSFDWGPAHFVALDTQRIDAEQAEWLDRDLAATDRPWKILYGHHPPYSSGTHGSTGSYREHLQPVLERHGVQLVLSGHDHDYERSEVMNGTTYVVTGAAGANPRPVGHEAWSAFASDTLHFVSLHIDQGELRGYAVDATGRVFDSFRSTL